MPSGKSNRKPNKQNKEDPTTNFEWEYVLVDNDKKVIKSKDFEKNVMKLSFGKKKHYMIKIN